MKATGNHLIKPAFLEKLRPMSLASAKLGIECSAQTHYSHYLGRMSL